MRWLLMDSHPVATVLLANVLLLLGGEVLRDDNGSIGRTYER